MKVEAKVVPNSREFGVRLTPEGIAVRLTERAEKGKANKELLKGLEKLLGCPVRILRGERSKNKLLEIGLTEDEFRKRFSAQE